MPGITVHRATTPIDLADGPDAACWRTADWHDGFSMLGEPSRQATVDTAFAAAHDGEKLVVAIRAAEPDLAGIDAPRPTVPRDVWNHDHVEIFVDVGGAGRACLQAGVNRHGDTAAVWRRGGAEYYDPDLHVSGAPAAFEGGWGALVALPLASLGFNTATGSWKINVGRIRVIGDEPPESTTFSAIRSEAFHEPDDFVTATPDGLDAADFCWQTTLEGPARLAAAGGDHRLRQRIRISNQTASAGALAVDLRLEGAAADPKAERLAIAAQEAGHVDLDVALETESFGRLDLTLRDADTNRCLHRAVLSPEDETFNWKEHLTLHGDGHGGFVSHPARYQFLAPYCGRRVVPYGLAAMDNGEIALMASATGERSQPVAVIAFSTDGGATWSDYRRVEHECGAPMMLTYMGGGELAFRSSWQRGGPHYYFSRDYGRTWTETVKVALSSDGLTIDCEGSPLVDRDADGNVVGFAETGQTHDADNRLRGCIHWSRDRGRTWTDFDYPDVWNWSDTYAGKTMTRSSGEGALVRTANGWVVAAMRMDCIGRYIKYAYDQFEGMGVSISRDEGRTWSPIQRVCEAGRMHANLLRLPNDDLIMTVIRRMDIRGGRLASYRRGCDAFVSRDHGQTWDHRERIIIDDWPHHDPDQWFGSVCGHLYSAALEDGSVLTCYSKHSIGGVLIRWQP